MSQTLLDLAFSAAVLNDALVVEKFGQERFDRYAQDLFMQGRDHSELAEGRVAKWRERALSRAPAPFTGAKAPAVALEGVDEDLKTCVMADIRVSSEPIPLDDLTSEGAAMNALETEFRNLGKRRGISKELLAWMALKGNVTINSTTVPGSKVSFSYTQPVKAHSPTASWGTAGTKLVSVELDTLHQTAHDSSGFEPARIIADRKIKGYITQNQEVQTLLTGGERKSDALAAVTKVLGPAFQPFEFNGYQWDVHGAKYSKSGTLTKYLGDNQLIALPDDDALPMVLGHAAGYGAIPREAIGANAAQLGGRAPNRGDYAYAYTIADPAAVVIVLGWRGLFFLTFPEAVLYMSDVTSP